MTRTDRKAPRGLAPFPPIGDNGAVAASENRDFVQLSVNQNREHRSENQNRARFGLEVK